MDRDHPFRSYYSLPSQPIVLERDTHRFNPYANVDIRFVMLGAAILALVMNLVSPWFFNNWFTPQYFYSGRWTWESLAFLMFGLKLSERGVVGNLGVRL